MQRFLARLVKNDCDFAVVEVTSEGVKQKRHCFIDFDVALVTNVCREHLEAHKGFSGYKKAKESIFKNIKKGKNKGMEKTIIANLDNEIAAGFLRFQSDKKVTFSIKKEQADVYGEALETGFDQNKIKINFGGKNFRLDLDLGGPFVIQNIVAALAVAKSVGIEEDVCKRALERIKVVPGRFEVVSKKPFVVVDYAHTTNAVEKLLSYSRERWPEKIVHVFGAAGGGRDKWKRGEIGELSEKFTDFSILTEENSFDEPVGKILEDIKNGFKDKTRVIIKPDRAGAIDRALEMDTGKQMFLLTGKGSETVIAGPLGRKTPYNDKKTVLCLLNNLE
jgi:UDP-N-acetylmuramoyl-L-alanyl-D-glutamate--2,6-diaminopimelate ligase